MQKQIKERYYSNGCLFCFPFNHIAELMYDYGKIIEGGRGYIVITNIYHLVEAMSGLGFE